MTNDKRHTPTPLKPVVTWKEFQSEIKALGLLPFGTFGYRKVGSKTIWVEHLRHRPLEEQLAYIKKELLDSNHAL